jgi:hypothetical protein
MGREKGTRLSMMYQKLKGLAMNRGNLAKIYIIENKIISRCRAARGVAKKKGKKLGLKLHKSLKTNVEKCQKTGSPSC